MRNSLFIPKWSKVCKAFATSSLTTRFPIRWTEVHLYLLGSPNNSLSYIFCPVIFYKLCFRSASTRYEFIVWSLCPRQVLEKSPVYDSSLNLLRILVISSRSNSNTCYADYKYTVSDCKDIDKMSRDSNILHRRIIGTTKSNVSDFFYSCMALFLSLPFYLIKIMKLSSFITSKNLCFRLYTVSFLPIQIIEDNIFNDVFVLKYLF